MDADYALMGSVIELSPDWDYLREAAKRSGREGRQARADIELFSKNQVFQVEAALVDVRGGTVMASARFEAEKMLPPPANTLGLQGLYIPSRAVDAVQAASAMNFCDLKLVLFGSDLWKSQELIQNDNSAYLEGAKFSTGFFAESEHPQVKKFTAAYKERYAAMPGQIAAQAYDATWIMGRALKGGASSREELRQAIRHTKNHDGASGRTSFDGRSDAVKRVPILRVNSVSRTFEQVQ
jgi:hypothetical protein